jgi:glycosyltransferase involved in cell wall biosynthesis
MRLKIPVIVSERVHPKYNSIGLRLFRRVFYPFAKAVVVQTKAIKEWMHFLSQQKIFVIHNPILKYENLCYDNNDLLINEHTIIAAGRLEYQKGFDLLLHAFAKVSNKFSEWNLIILGEGSKRIYLEELIVKLNLTKSVQLPGKRKEFQSLLKQGGLFVLSSRFEGFPNVLLEAMSCGLPVVSFNCLSGPSDIINDGYNGILVPPEDVDALADAMINLISNKNERQKLGVNACEVVNTFHIDKIMQQWDELVAHVLYKQRKKK